MPELNCLNNLFAFQKKKTKKIIKIHFVDDLFVENMDKLLFFCFLFVCHIGKQTISQIHTQNRTE